MTREMTGAEMVVETLKDQGVRHIFGYPGGAVLPIYDALFQQDEVRHILVRHEQGAVHAAEGYARSTGKVGCVLVTSGPGATNAVTGLTDALCDSIPIVCITGQVPTHLIGNDAFQECDTVGITRPCTKYNYLVKDDRRPAARAARGLLHRRKRAGPDRWWSTSPRTCSSRPASTPAQRVPPQGLPAEAQGRPRQDQGGGRADADGEAAGVLHRRRRGQFRPAGLRCCCANWCGLTGFPITSTLMGLGAFPAADPQWLGMLGMHGTYEANLAMHDCDLMICIGARFDDRITGRLDAFSPGSQQDPRRYRPVLDQQERQGRPRPSSAIAATCSTTCSRSGARAAAEAGPRGAQDVVEADRPSGARANA